MMGVTLVTAYYDLVPEVTIIGVTLVTAYYELVLEVMILFQR